MERSPAFFQPKDYLTYPDVDLLTFMLATPRFDENKPLYIDAANPSRTLSFRQSRALIQQIAAGFKSIGVEAGDCVCIHAGNDIYYPILVLGIIAAGGIFTGTSPASTRQEMELHIKTAEVKYIITEASLLASIPSSSRILIFDTPDAPISSSTHETFTSLLTRGSAPWLRPASLDTPCFRLFSSGTTGLPKAVDLSHANLIAMYTVNNAYPAITPPDHVYLAPLPMHLVAAAPFVHTVILKSGYTAVVMKRFELDEYLRNIDRFGVTNINVVPTLVTGILNSPLIKRGEVNLKTLKHVVVGAAPLSRAVQRRFVEALGGPGRVQVTQIWGMTEASGVVCRFWDEADDTGSVGYLIPNLEAKIINDAGSDISAADTAGEICLRGPTIINGYFNAPAQTALSWDSEGFFHTGDIGYCSARGKWYIVDRKKEMIKIKAFSVAPAEIEGVVMQCPGVLDAAVIGVAKERGREEEGEVVRAYVVAREGVREEDVMAWVRERLSWWKWVQSVRFVDALPKTAAGKFLKNELRRWADDEEKKGSRL